MSPAEEKTLEHSTTEIIPLPVRPLVTPEQAAKESRAFEELKKQLLVKDDYQAIAGKQYIKKSGFRRIALCFNLSDRIIEQERTDRDDGSFTWRIVVEAQAPNGRVCSGVGICDSKERKFAHVEHDIYATCHTRAKNRAISDMVAGGVVSAEEMSSTPREATSRPDSTSVLDTVVLKKGWNWDRLFEKYSPLIEKRHKELGEKKFTFEFAAVVIAREKGLVDNQELPT